MDTPLITGCGGHIAFSHRSQYEEGRDRKGYDWAEGGISDSKIQELKAFSLRICGDRILPRLVWGIIRGKKFL